MNPQFNIPLSNLNREKVENTPRCNGSGRLNSENIDDFFDDRAYTAPARPLT